MRKLRAPTRKPVVVQPVFPNAGVTSWYRGKLDELINATERELLYDVRKAYEKTPPLFAGSHITAYDEAQPNAAGVIFRAPSGRYLWVHRTDGEGWAWPGGGVEENETAEATARREAFEETLQPVNGPLVYVTTQPHGAIRFAVFMYDVLEEFTPQLNSEHDEFRWVSPEQVHDVFEGSGIHPGAWEVLDSTFTSFELFAQIAQDAPSPTKALQIALQKWGTQTIKRFDLMAKSIADDFTARNAQATQAAMMSKLKQAGFAVKFSPTRKSIEAFRAVAAENVALIKSIPRKWHEQVEQKVWNAVRKGSDLHSLSVDLRKTHKVTVDRAALIARDQNAKAKATIERVRQQELGIRRGIWMHSTAGKEPRPTHVAMNNQPYNLSKGIWDSDEQEFVHPGQLINCRCTNRPIIEGFED